MDIYSTIHKVKSVTVHRVHQQGTGTWVLRVNIRTEKEDGGTELTLFSSNKDSLFIHRARSRF